MDGLESLGDVGVEVQAGVAGVNDGLVLGLGEPDELGVDVLVVLAQGDGRALNAEGGGGEAVGRVVEQVGADARRAGFGGS